MIHSFTGNNISPRGDMTSRSLNCRLAVDRPDPENRPFRHPDPIGWTENHRGQILAALYTILLGNPRRAKRPHGAAPTRFKVWWDLVGYAVEFAAEQHMILSTQEVAGLVADPEPVPPVEISFAKMFFAGEREDEQQNSLAIVLQVLHRKFGPEKFHAAEVACYAGEAEEGAIALRDALEHASGKPLKTVSAVTITWKLKSLLDAPVDVGDRRRLVLRYLPAHEGSSFKIDSLDR